MKGTTELFDLIKSLNGAEKGYFKKHSTINTPSEKNYLLLFDSIEEQKEYNEKMLRDKFKSKKFSRQFPVIKSYLYGRVLTALDSYHDSEYETVRHYLHQTEILYEKGLYKQSLKIINKAKKISLRFELHIFLPEIMLWEHTIASQKLDFKKRIQILKEHEEELLLLENARTFQLLSAQIALFVQKYGEEKKAKSLREIKRIMMHPVLRDVSNARSTAAQIKFYYLHMAYCYLKEKYSEAYNFLEKEYALFHESPEKIHLYFQSYISCLYRLVNICLKLKNYTAFEKYLAVIKNAALLAKNRSYKARLFHGYSNFLTDYIILSGQFHKASKMIPEIINDFNKYESELNTY